MAYNNRLVGFRSHNNGPVGLRFQHNSPYNNGLTPGGRGWARAGAAGGRAGATGEQVRAGGRARREGMPRRRRLASGCKSWSTGHHNSPCHNGLIPYTRRSAALVERGGSSGVCY